MRQCPTLPGDDRPLIAHSIGMSLCAERQRGFYHKCHRCVFRGKPPDFSLESTNQNGVAVKPTADRGAGDDSSGSEQPVEELTGTGRH